MSHRRLHRGIRLYRGINPNCDLRGVRLQRYDVFLNFASFRTKKCFEGENIACNCKKRSDDEKNVSDAELGRRLGVSRQTVNNVVNGRRDITVGRLHVFANALGVRVRDLFDE